MVTEEGNKVQEAFRKLKQVDAKLNQIMNKNFEKEVFVSQPIARHRPALPGNKKQTERDFKSPLRSQKFLKPIAETFFLTKPFLGFI